MARPKKIKTDAATTTETDEKKDGQVVHVRPKTAFQWDALLKKAADNHWRKLHVTIQIHHRILAGKPAALDAAKAMLKARGLEDQIEAVPIDDPNARAEAAAQAVDEGLCEFHRRDGKTGIWYPTNHLKAGVKENWSVLGYRNEFRGSKGALAEAVFVQSIHPPEVDNAERNWIYLGEKPDGVETKVAHTQSPKGPISSIKRHEYLLRPKLKFEIILAKAILEKLPDDAVAHMFIHYGAHGMGACRSQGEGTFDVLEVYDVGACDAPELTSVPGDDEKAA